MSSHDAAAADVARAILDGTPIPWPDQNGAVDDEDRHLLDALKLLADVADFHRDLHLPASAASRGGTAQEARPEPRQWGHLRIVESIGRGSFGEVYRAWDTRLDRDVALKILPAAPAERGRQAIIHEGRLLARVRHRNVVVIYGAEQIGDQIGLWMELVQGPTLDEAVREGRVFSAAEVVEIGVELCRAVAAVHAAGLLHRDIKAQNVALSETRASC